MLLPAPHEPVHHSQGGRGASASTCCMGCHVAFSGLHGKVALQQRVICPPTRDVRNAGEWRNGAAGGASSCVNACTKRCGDAGRMRSISFASTRPKRHMFPATATATASLLPPPRVASTRRPRTGTSTLAKPMQHALWLPHATAQATQHAHRRTSCATCESTACVTVSPTPIFLATSVSASSPRHRHRHR